MGMSGSGSQKKSQEWPYIWELPARRDRMHVKREEHLALNCEQHRTKRLGGRGKAQENRARKKECQGSVMSQEPRQEAFSSPTPPAGQVR